MAATANPNGNHNDSNAPSSLQRNGVAKDGAGAVRELKHNPGLSLEWSAEEQAKLEEGLSKYASDSSITRYVKIARELQDKTVRDVVLRCRWMSKKENGKRRKDDHNQMRKNNKKSANDPSKSSAHPAARSSVPHPVPMPILPMDSDDDIPYQDIGGPIGQLLEQNTQFSNQISANLASFLIQENINLLCQMRDNILTIMNDSSNDMPGVTGQMPPLPKVNEVLANSILPQAPSQMQS